MSQSDPEKLPNHDREFAEKMADVEQTLLRLKQRYRQVQGDQQQQKAISEQLQALNPSDEDDPDPHLIPQIEDLKAQLQELELHLESSLLSNPDLLRLLWQEVRRGLLGDVFWQIVRFGGLGVIIGWVLKSCSLT